MYGLKVALQLLVLWAVLSVAAIALWRLFDRKVLQRHGL